MYNEVLTEFMKLSAPIPGLNVKSISPFSLFILAILFRELADTDVKSPTTINFSSLDSLLFDELSNPLLTRTMS